MNVTDLIQQMLILLIFMAVGAVAYKTGVIDEDGNRKLTKLLLYVTQAAMILGSAMNSELDIGPKDVLKLFLYACAMYAVLVGLAYLLSPLYRVSADRKKIFRFMTIFGNVAFMGFPVVSAVFGPEAVLVASIYCLPFNVLSYSVGIVMLCSGKERKINWRLMLNPAMAATVLALILIFTRAHIPYVIYQATTTLGSMTVPGAMLVIGVTLGSTSLKSVFGDGYIYLLCFIKLIASPAIVWAILRFIVPDKTFLGILVLLASMPVAAISTMFSIEYGGDAETACKGVFLTTVLSVVTSPLMCYLLIG